MTVQEWASDEYDASWYYGNLRVISDRCWACHSRRKPRNWFGPWLLERAHIVSSPRREDRRLVNMLCTICHKFQHGERLHGFARPKLRLDHMIWLKEENDPDWVDFKFMQKHSIKKLPRKVIVPKWYLNEREKNK